MLSMLGFQAPTPFGKKTQIESQKASYHARLPFFVNSNEKYFHCSNTVGLSSQGRRRPNRKGGAPRLVQLTMLYPPPVRIFPTLNGQFMDMLVMSRQNPRLPDPISNHLANNSHHLVPLLNRGAPPQESPSRSSQTQLCQTPSSTSVRRMQTLMSLLSMLTPQWTLYLNFRQRIQASTGPLP